MVDRVEWLVAGAPAALIAAQGGAARRRPRRLRDRLVHRAIELLVGEQNKKNAVILATV